MKRSLGEVPSSSLDCFAPIESDEPLPPRRRRRRPAVEDLAQIAVGYIEGQAILGAMGALLLGLGAWGVLLFWILRDLLR